MATNEVFKQGDRLSLPVPNSTPAGAMVKVGGLFGVTMTGTGANGEGQGGNITGQATVWLRGVYKLTVTGANTTIGAPVYWDDTAKKVTMTATSNTLCGNIMELKSSGDGPARVRLNN